jgi:hypothetical protein
MAKTNRAAKAAARKPEKMTEADLAALCAREWEHGMDGITLISKERENGLNGYNQEKYGNEEEGLSGYVASDIHDSVEWTLPQVMDAFVSGDTPVTFEPRNEEDVEPAEIESSYCQYVLMNKNPGFLILYTWFKDALIQKNGIVKSWWQDTEEYQREEYKGKDLATYLALDADEDYEIKQITVCIGETEYTETQFVTMLSNFTSASAAGQIEEAARFDIVGHRKKKGGKVRVENVAPENFMIKKDWPSILVKDCPYTADYQKLTRSQLLDEGYDAAIVDELPANVRIDEINNERANRMKKETGAALGNSATSSSTDKSRDEIIVYNHYIRADYDGDGYAELRNVRTVGKGGKDVLHNKEVDRNIYHTLTPYLNCHKFFGKSLADVLQDIQKAKSQLWRNMFDNVMYSSIPRKIIGGTVNVDDLLTFVHGGIIRKGANGTVENDNIPFVAGDCMPLSDKLDSVRAERTGFSKETAGLDPSALSNTTNLAGMALLSQSQLLVKMVVSLLAHSGFTSLILHIRELCEKYENQEVIFDLTGQVLKTDPRAWTKERSATVQVGVGFAGKLEKVATVERVIALQEKLVEGQGGLDGPLVGADNIYNATKKLTKIMGVKDTATYFKNPKDYVAPPKQPTLLEITTKADIDDKAFKNKNEEAKIVNARLKDKQDHEYRMADLATKQTIAFEEIESKEQIAAAELKYKYGEKAGKAIEGQEDRKVRREETLKKTKKESK